MSDVRLHLGDCLDVLPTVPDASVDAIICDPPYAEVDRSYGRLTETEWHDLMRAVVVESRRALKPNGSAVFVLQPNYETPGRMRLWLWEFVVWAGKEWGLVQDAYWWNTTALPASGCQRPVGLMRSSVKPCVWLGPETCYRNQDAVLWAESDANRAQRLTARFVDARLPHPSGKGNNRVTLNAVAGERGGVTPFNLFPIARGSVNGPNGGHGATTPPELTDYWTRYICPAGGTICDPFMGSGTTGLSALKYSCSYVGIERDPGYFATAEKRVAVAKAERASLLPLASG